MIPLVLLNMRKKLYTHKKSFTYNVSARMANFLCLIYCLDLSVDFLCY